MFTSVFRSHTSDDGTSSTPQPLPPLEGFTVDKVLLLNPKLKTVSVVGKFADKPNEQAVIFAEKLPLSESDLTQLFSTDTKLTQHFQNDIYAQYRAACSNGIGSLKLLTVYPATDAHVVKYSDQSLRIIHETPEDYRTITEPFIERQAFGIEVSEIHVHTFTWQTMTYISLARAHKNGRLE